MLKIKPGRKTIAINDGTSIRADQLVPLPEYWQNDDGTWSHHYDAKRKWADEIACKTDLRLTKEWLWDK